MIKRNRFSLKIAPVNGILMLMKCPKPQTSSKAQVRSSFDLTTAISGTLDEYVYDSAWKIPPKQGIDS